MKEFDILTMPWAIDPVKLGEIQEIYVNHLRGEKIRPEAVGAVKKSLPGPKGYDIQNGVAILGLNGLIFKEMNLMIRIFGGVSAKQIAEAFGQALADSAVKSILFYIDSPGGGVEGVQELANEIYNAHGQKPIIAYSDGVMHSAAYWIGSAADRVFISGDNVQVGSIGVVARHTDLSQADAMAGIKKTNVIAGKYKQVASEIEPLNDIGRKIIQEAVDHIYEVFVGDVAKFRGLSPEPVKDGKEEIIPWAEGHIFLGKDGIAAGLVDAVRPLCEIIEEGAVIDPSILAVRAAVRAQVQAVLSGKAAPVNSAEEEVNPILEKQMAEAHVNPIQHFDVLVKCFMAQGLKRGEAIIKAAHEFPELHENYIAQLNTKGPHDR